MRVHDRAPQRSFAMRPVQTLAPVVSRQRDSMQHRSLRQLQPAGAFAVSMFVMCAWPYSFS
jgi:hypothetical protein